MGNRDDPADRTITEAIEKIYRAESRRVLATLIRLLGDFDLGEEALQEAFCAASRQWPTEGIPRNPRAWLVSTGRFRTIDRLRRSHRMRRALLELAERETAIDPQPEEPIADDRLRLIFTCCHPELPPDARIALTLREVCGVPTEAIARAFLIKTATVAQRIVRAKSRLHGRAGSQASDQARSHGRAGSRASDQARIRDRKIRYAVPDPQAWPARMASVLRVVYLVYTAGYAAGAPREAIDLCDEAIRLARLVTELTSDTEASGLLALMLLQESRREARFTANGDIVLLEHQDRTLWNRDLIAEGRRLVSGLVEREPIGSYTIQAAIAAVHAGADTYDATDWNQVIRWYDLLAVADPSPVVRLNRAAAISVRDGPEAGLASLATLEQDGTLRQYHLFHAAKADALRRLGRNREAVLAYRRALAIATNRSEQRFLKQRIGEIYVATKD